MFSVLRASSGSSWVPLLARSLYARPLARALPSPSSLSSPLAQSHLRRAFHPTPAAQRTINQSMRSKRKPKKSKEPRSPLLDNCPQRKGVVTRLIIAKPKKPNSAKRKVARVKMSNGENLMAYIQGEGHNLQEHSVVLVRGGRTKDLPGVG